MAELELLSPLHIGDGERLTGFDYVRDGSRLRVYLFDRVVGVISQEEGTKRENMLLRLRSYENHRVLERLFEDFGYLRGKIEPVYSLEVKGNLQSAQVDSFIKSMYR
ncbi:MAG: hypothetical protein D6699_04795, partial [Aquificota bacterium]